MTRVSVEGEITAPVEKVWEVLRAFGDLRWARIEATLEGEGVGSIRTFKTTAGDLVVQERLESLDEVARELSYTLLDAGSLPWTDYLASIALRDRDGHTHLTWQARFEPRGVTEEQAQAIVRNIFENGIRNLQRATA